MSKYGFIGTGNMGSALATALSKKVNKENLLLADLASEKAENLWQNAN